MRGIALILGIWTATSFVVGPIVGLWLRRMSGDARAADTPGHDRPSTVVVI